MAAFCPAPAADELRNDSRIVSEFYARDFFDIAWIGQTASGATSVPGSRFALLANSSAPPQDSLATRDVKPT